MSNSNIRFDQIAMDDAEEEFKTAILNSEQKKMIKVMTMMIGDRLPVKPMAIRGFCWIAIRKWQTENHQPLTAISTMPPEQRLAAVQDLIEEGKKTYVKVLRTPEAKHEVEKVFDDAFHTYQKMKRDNSNT